MNDESSTRHEEPNPPPGWTRQSTTHRNGSLEVHDTASFEVPDSSERLVRYIIGQRGPSITGSILEWRWQVERGGKVLGAGYPPDRSWSTCERESALFAGGVIIGLREATP